MALTAKDITNLYLYGQLTTPSNKVSDTFIRQPSATKTANAESMQDFMATGPGRFVKGQHFNLVDEFFNADISDFTEHSGFQYGIAYKKTDIASFLEMSTAKTPGVDYDEAALYQTSFSDGTDYAERVYIYNSGTYLVAPDAEFTILANGERQIDKFSIRVFDDNYDFDGGGLAAILNWELEPVIDPSKIGRTVEIPFSGTVSENLYDYNHNGYYDISDYAHEQTLINGYGGFSFTKLNADMADLTLDLWTNGTRRFLDAENRPIIYGTTGPDNLDEGDIRGSSWADLNGVPTIDDSAYEDNGLVLIGGKGDDRLTGSSEGDSLLGGDDKDILKGGKGADVLIGGAGDDILFAKDGHDSLDGGANDDDLMDDAADPIAARYRAEKRVGELKERGFQNAGLYNPQGVGGTHVMYVLKHADRPELEDLPKDPSISPMVSLWKGIAKPLAVAGMVGAVLAGFFHYMKVGPIEEKADDKAEADNGKGDAA